ncbi:tetratricopeptide repeat protein [Cylindrospermopsis raciborskii MVCC19]|nr:tetratricopeptide repeat protein [Cylindrospermopsis raciborskii MVCC19]
MSQSKISSKILKLLVNSNNITPEIILGLPIKESRPWINYISKFFNKDIDEQEKIFKQRREKYLELLRKYKEIDDYNQDIKINPNDPEYYYNRGNTRSDLGDKQGAIDDYTQVIKLNPNSAYAYILRGNVRSALGDKQGATDDYIQTIKLDHNFAYAYIPQGNVRTASGDNQDAIDDYIQVITLVNPDPKNRIIFIEQQ